MEDVDDDGPHNEAGLSDLISKLRDNSGYHLDTTAQSEAQPAITKMEGEHLPYKYVKLGLYNKLFVGKRAVATNGALFFDFEADRPRFYTMILVSRNSRFLVRLDLEETLTGGEALANSSLLTPGARKSLKFTLNLILDYYDNTEKLEEMRAKIRSRALLKEGGIVQLRI